MDKIRVALPVILEDDETGNLKKIVADSQGGYNLFKMRNYEWEWDDSIGDESRNNLMESARNVYVLCERKWKK